MLVNPNKFCNAFKQRLIDNFTQTWRTDVENNQKLTLYKHFKCNFEYERYMYMIQHRKYRNALAVKTGVTRFAYRDRAIW